MNKIFLCFVFVFHSAYLFLLFSALLFGKQPCPSRHVGSIDPYCNVVSVINDAFENARFLCDQYYLVSPDLVVKEHNGKGYCICEGISNDIDHEKNILGKWRGLKKVVTLLQVLLKVAPLKLCMFLLISIIWFSNCSKTQWEL